MNRPFLLPCLRKIERGRRGVIFTETLKKNYEFRRIYAKGRSYAVPCMVVYARKGKRNRNRIGFTVSTKLGCAVVRNRVRRRLREIYRLHEAELLPGWELIFVARGRAVNARYRTLEQELLRALDKLELLRGKEES